MTPENSRAPISEEVREVRLSGVAGGPVLRLSIVALVIAAVLLSFAVRTSMHGGHGGIRFGFWAGTVVLLAAGTVGLRGLAKLAPGDAVVVQFLGDYVGSLRAPGLWWVNPYTRRRTLSTKVRTDQTPILKVNDADGIPIEVAMVVNWQVSDTARALFVVDDIAQYVEGQCAMALRHVVASHRYQPQRDDAPSLSTSAEIADELSREVALRVDPAGITVLESQIVRIAYAPEIAQAMLRRQQAAAIVAARQQIVEGAVGMVRLALERLDEEHVVDLDEERKATMVSNLLVVLCSDHPTQPMVNAGSLYL